MAIPISIPDGDDSEENYRSLDLLLEQLLMTLRQVIMHRRREAAANAQNIRRKLMIFEIIYLLMKFTWGKIF